ncbi:MAG: zinc-dependent metalloprotease [Flavobacteriales bacterium]|nr:zinc-dependent metalloprotease [Flavobacteriales bacterium]
MIKNIYSAVLALLLATGISVAQNTVKVPVTKIGANSSLLTGKNSVSVDEHIDGTIGEKCGQHSYTEALKAIDPVYRQGWQDAQEMTSRIAAEFESGERAAPPVYTIPVVFHVIHKGEAVGSGTNISDAQIESAIDALNRDYRRTSADGAIGQGLGPDTEIQFCLAGVDPNGNPHSGINRVNGTSVSGYSSSGITNSNEVSVKGLSRWDNRYYLNVWIVSEIENQGSDLANPSNWSGGTLGYAYQPSTPVTNNSQRDGIVVVNICIGNDPNQNQGFRLWPWGSLTNRTLTHEVGHYLGLSHTFSDSSPNTCSDGDGFADTPNAKQVSMSNCTYNGNCSGQMITNYMDYTPEDCQNRFTTNQTSYMRSVLAGVRNAVVNTNNCGVSTNFDAAISAISVPTGSLCNTTFSPIVTLSNYGSTTLSSVQIQYYIDSNSPTTYNWTGSLASNSSVNVTLNSMTTSATTHTFTAKTVSGSLNGSNTDQVTSNDQTTSSFNVASGGSSVTLTLNLDCYGDEITWEIRNSSNQLITSGGPYVNNTSGQQVVESLCLAEDCYDFIIDDSFGDGMYGSQYTQCTINGNYTITQGNTTLVQMTATNANFGSSATHNFCIGGGGTTTTCEDLMAFDGDLFYVNDTDAPNFDVLAADIDQQAVATTLANVGWNSEWMGFYTVVAPGDTNFFLRATSWFVNTTVPANNWLTFGPITMPSDGGTLSWKHRYGNNLYRDGYSVLLNTTGTSVANFTGATTLFSVADNAASTDGDTIWTAQSVPLPSNPYAFQSVYIGFRHTALDQLYLDLDDIIIEGCSSITVDISETEKFDLRVYPNPSSENFTFSYNSDAISKLDFRMLNSVGQEVWNYQSTGPTGTHQIDTRGLAVGVYTLIVKGDNLNVSERLILTK